MPSYLKIRKIQYPIYALLIFLILILGVLSFYNWIFSLIAFIGLVTIFYFFFQFQHIEQKEIETYISTLSYRVKKVGEEALMEMPIGIMLIDNEYMIEWANPYIHSCFQEESLLGKSLYDVYDQLIPIIQKGEEAATIHISERIFRVHYRTEERLIYFFDITEQVEVEKMYEENRTVIAYIFLDNYDELTQGMDDKTRSALNSLVTTLLNNWAKEHGIFLKRVHSDRFVAVFNEQILNELEKNRFAILDTIRETTSKHNIPLTLSIGVGSGVHELPELGELAQSSLDLALGRGGDQVAIKQLNGKIKFYGGKTNPVEKRTRVRARVISHALMELIMERENVIIMGHKNPDMDAVGAAIGILKIAEMNDRPGYIVMNFHEMGVAVNRLMNEIKKKKELYSRFITPDDALDLITDDTLLIIVDTHKPSLVIDERLLEEIDDVVVIDHHRRGEEFVKNPLLVYMEPYASSTAELVTELLQYQPKRGKLDILEATALLAGIIVDTKSFTLRTGSRTFDAASFLRAQGADTILVQKFLKEDVQTYLKRSKLIERAYFYRDGIAITKGYDDEEIEQVLIAQTADTLLAMDGIIASFVISKKQDGAIGISARSLGEINVQLIMESLDGGGHLTNAATQIYDETIDEVEQRLQQAIDEYLEGRQEE